ncbi:MAG: hypothetical protein IT427_13715 [Pirellulales bacterium]|nr:hypothetical protein [Pirellulales bacterium]
MKRFQFSLATLLLTPLVLSPLLIATNEYRNVAVNHQLQTGLNTMLLGISYIMVLTLIDCTRRRPVTNCDLWRSTILGAIRGSLYGLLYIPVDFPSSRLRKSIFHLTAVRLTVQQSAVTCQVIWV